MAGVSSFSVLTHHFYPPCLTSSSLSLYLFLSTVFAHTVVGLFASSLVPPLPSSSFLSPDNPLPPRLSLFLCLSLALSPPMSCYLSITSLLWLDCSTNCGQHTCVTQDAPSAQLCFSRSLSITLSVSFRLVIFYVFLSSDIAFRH